MYSIITTFERPSELVPYFMESEPVLRTELLDFIQSLTPQLVDVDTTDFSNVVQVTIATYADETTYQEFMDLFTESFPTFMADRDAYCAQNSITIDRSVINN